MKYRILFTGSANSIIGELFERLSEDYELMTTSIRYRDIDSHLKIFAPQMFVYCLNNENITDIKHVAELRSYIENANVDIAVIGTQSECEVFQSVTANMAKLVIHTPATTLETVCKLDTFIKGKMSPADDEPAARKHILVIDDDPQMLRIIKEMLHDRYDIGTAISGKVAYKFLEKRTTDLILLDYEMPEEKGPQVLVRIREELGLKDIPIYFLTGNTDRAIIKEAMSYNPQGYLVKPIDKETLTDSIKKLIG